MALINKPELTIVDYVDILRYDYMAKNLVMIRGL
jgi:hypothetical protein